MAETETKEKKRGGMLRRFLAYFRPHWKLFAADLFCAAFVAAVDLVFPVLTRWTLNALLPEKLFAFFFAIAGAMLALYLLQTAASYFVAYFGHLFGVHVETDMRRDIFNHIENQGFAFFDSRRTGHIMSRITYDLFEVTELSHHGPEDVFVSVVTLVGSFCIMLAIRWELALLIFLLLPALIFYTMRSRKRLGGASKAVNEKTAEINAATESSVSGARVTKAFTNEQFEARVFSRANMEFFKAKKQYYRSMAAFHCKVEFVTRLLNVVVLAAGGFLIMHGKMNLADLVAANLFVAAFLAPIRRLSNFVEQFTKGMAGFSRFCEIMDTHCETPEKPGALPLKNPRGEIVFQNVSFAYNENVSVLENINFTVRPGEKLAIAGPSGGGKTTLCHLLPRFYEITGGKITIGGEDIRDVSLSSLRGSIGLVQQDVFIFAGTIRKNIAYGKPDASDAEIEEAARRAEIHDDIMKMPDGYETVVGERDIKLSGGQKQRISIARIFLKNPPVLILDEATSALDSATELKIQSAFDALSEGRTTLVIAHRLSTIRNADTILVVTDEGIEERGTHEELMAKGGIYKKLYTAQYG